MSEEVNIVYGETAVQATTASVHGAHATVEEITEIGCKIWKEVRESKVAAGGAERSARLRARIREDYREFAESFPLVLRWIVEQQVFSKKALDRFLRLHATKKLDTREAFLELQAEYVVNCWREQNPRKGAKAVAAVRTRVVAMLLEEDKQFTEAAEAAKKEAEALKTKTRAALLGDIQRLAAAIHSEGGVAALRGGPDSAEAVAARAARAAQVPEGPEAAGAAEAAQAGSC